MSEKGGNAGDGNGATKGNCENGSICYGNEN